MIGEQLVRAWRWVEDGLVIASATALVLLAGVQIVLRIGFDSGLPWAEGVLRTLVLWVAMFGAVVATRESRHVAIDALGQRLPPAPRRAVRIVVGLLAALTCAGLAYYAYGLLRMEWSVPASAAKPIAPGYSWLVVVAALVMMAGRYLEQAAAALRGRAS